jgi:molybdopterin/thiamine biosynthesis adenylyltransferase
MTNEELNRLSEEVREEGLNQGSSMKDLVFDPVTGDFRQVPRGSHRGEGDVVTEMTNKGFAAEGTSLEVYLNEDDVNEIRQKLSTEEKTEGFAELLDEEVLHVHLKIKKTRYSTDLIPVIFTKDERLTLRHEGDDTLYLIMSDTEVTAYFLSNRRRVPVMVNYIPSKENIFSRSKGILEVGALKDKKVVIIGLGSFGSQIAIELAKAGVGNFSLMDFDRVELHNLSRHTATVRDLGRLKTNVIEEAILGKNPYAVVRKYPVDINKDLELLHSEIETADLVICATDNNTSRFNISKALVDKAKVGIFGRAITRAEGGDVFRYRPDGPCYCCLIGEGNLQQEEITNVESARRDGRIAAYVSPEDADAMVQVGLSSDIEPICNLMVKLALVELSRGTETGISSLEEELVYDYYMWANRRERHYSNWKSLPEPGNLPTILRWYGVKTTKEENCPICSENIVLDDGDDIQASTMADISIDLS